MQSIELIRENLRKSEEIVLARIHEMREHCLVFPTPKGGCHTLWVLGHLAYIESLIINHFMLGEPNRLAEWEPIFDGDEICDEADRYPAFDRVLEECKSVRAATRSLLNSLTEEDLDSLSKNAPSGADELFGTFRRCFQYAADHWYMHRGQLADARRAAGLERMWY